MKFRRENTIVINGNKTHNLKRKFFILLIIILIDVVLIRHFTIVHIANKNLDEQASKFQNLNEETVFSIDKIYLYSSAGAIENKETRPVWNLDLYQYTDIAIYINNRSSTELDHKNSIKSMYIDNIKFTEMEKGSPGLYYKNINDFGKSIFEKAIEESNLSKTIIQENNDTQENNAQQNNTENFNLDTTQNEIKTENTANNPQESKIDEIEQKKQIIQNTENTKIGEKLEYTILNDGDIDYTKPQAYADCSTPITLEYVNNNVKQNQIISDTNNEIILDGNILRRSGVILSEISCTLSFNITIINYYNKKFVASVYIDIPLEDTATGENIYKGKFVKKLENTNLIKFFRLE